MLQESLLPAMPPTLFLPTYEFPVHHSLFLFAKQNKYTAYNLLKVVLIEYSFLITTVLQIHCRHFTKYRKVSK